MSSSAKLDQLLGYLDRKDVSEIIVGVGRPITIKLGQGYTPLTSLPVTDAQFQALFAGTQLASLTRTSGAQPTECEVGARRLRIELIRRGEETALRIQTAPPLDRTAPAIDRTQAMDVVPGGRTQAMDVAPGGRTQPMDVVPGGRTQAMDVVPGGRTQPMEHVANAGPTQPMSVEPVLPTTRFATPKRAAAAPAMPSIEMPSLATTDTAGEAAVEPAIEAPGEPYEIESSPDSELVDERVDIAAITGYVRAARKCGASDLHIAAGRAIQVRVMGELQPLAPDPVPPDVVERVLLPLLGPRRRAQLQTAGYVDLAFDVPNAGRLRANISRLQGGLRGAFRLARVTPPTLDELNLPRELAKVVAHHQGLVVIAGPNGQGKTTTLAALVDLVNSTKPYHIITVEDPVELEHPRKQAVITQREVGRHTKSFAAALKASLREDPDVIVIGELRDRETVEIALTAAETGHLVLATMSTPSAAKTIDRLIDMFPPADQAQARASIAGALRAIVAQRLVPARDGQGVVPAVEVVTGVLPLAVLIRDDKLYQLPNLMQRGRAYGMIRFEDSLLELLRVGKISEDTLQRYSPAAAAQVKAQQTQAMGRVGRRE